MFGLVACVPEHNWREASPAQGGFVVMMPGKPDSMSREIDLNGLKIKMHMIGSKIEPVSYTVAWVHTESAAQAQKAVEAMRLGMLKNLGLADQAGRPVQVRLKPIAGQERGGEPVKTAGLALEVQGPAQKMQARFVAYGKRALQVVVVGKTLDAEAAAQF